MKFEKIQAGQTLYDVHSYRMGQSKMRSVGIWEVAILSVDTLNRTAMVSWNGNRPEVMYESSLSKLRVNKPELERDMMGRAYIKRRGTAAGHFGDGGGI